MTLKKPLVIETEWVKPFDDISSAVFCMNCSTEKARWSVGKDPNIYFSCARCFLYSSIWGAAHSDQIKELVFEVENSIKRKISDDGIVWPNEADRILSSIVAISTIIRSRTQRRTRDEGTGS